MSPWLQSLKTEPNAALALEMLEVVGPYHRDCHTGATPLHLMAFVPDGGGAWNMLSALLIQGADPYARDDRGDTALTYLAKSPYARAAQVFPAWYKKIGPIVDGFCESTTMPSHVAVALLLRHHDSLDEEAAVRILAACSDIYTVSKQKLTAEHKIAFVRDTIRWVCGPVGAERRERLETLERMPSVAVGEQIFRCRREPRGSEWRILRMLLAHMCTCEPQRYNPLMSVELMDDICSAREIGVEHLVHAVSEFRALPMTWFDNETLRRPPGYEILLGMFNLNKDFPGKRVSSALARQVKKMRKSKLMQEPMRPQITDYDSVKLVLEVRHAAQEHADDAAGRGFMSRVFDAMDIFNSLNCSPLFDDDWTAEAIVHEASPDDARILPPYAAADEQRPKPAVHFPPPAAATSTVSESTEFGAAPTRGVPTAGDFPALAPDNALLPVMAQGIEPLVRDLRAGRLAENYLQPLHALAEAACACPMLLRGFVPLFDQAMKSLRAAHDAADSTAAQTAKDVREHVTLVSAALRNEVLQGVILGTAGIGESERMQRTTKHLVTRAFVQVLACTLSQAFALVCLSADGQERSAALRRLMFRVAPDKWLWAQDCAETMNAVTELFQLVNGIKELCEKQPQLECSVVTTLGRAGAR